MLSAREIELDAIKTEIRIIRERLGIPPTMSNDEGIDWKIQQHERWHHQVAEKVGVQLN